MTAITFNNLKSLRKEKISNQAELYTDISLDLKIDENTKDLTPSFDEVAVKNAIQNILSTKPGENFLYPTFGLNISKHLFEPISEFNAEILGEEVVNSITKFEPRVTVLNVGVGVNIDEQRYSVTIVLYIPSIGRRVSFNPIFTNDGMYFLGNNKYV